MGRLSIALHSRSLASQAAAAEAREHDALARLGEEVEHEPAGADLTPWAAALAARDELERWRARLSTSLDQDRADYAIASRSGRLLVVARGMLDRSVVRARVRHCEEALREARVELGRTALERCRRGAPATGQADLVLEIRAARDQASAARRAREELLAPYGGEQDPAWLREALSCGRFLARESRSKLAPRLPALAGVAIGWWIGRRFSSSRLEEGLGWLGLSDKRAVSEETLGLLRFWGPIAAAALCAYCCAFAAGRIRKRYASPGPRGLGEPVSPTSTRRAGPV